MGKEWLWWLGEFGLAAVVAVVAGFVTRDVSLSILYGLFVGTVFFILREHRRIGTKLEKNVDELEDKALSFPVQLGHLKETDPYLKQLARSARDEAIRIIKEVADDHVNLHSRTLADISGGIVKLAKPGDKIFATNYGVMFQTPQGNAARQINFEQADKGVDITRVFVESVSARSEDKRLIREEMERQKKHLKVRFIKESELPADMRRNMLFMYDRLVAYASYTTFGSSSKTQLTDEIKIYTNREELEKAKEWAETIIKLSEEYK